MTATRRRAPSISTLERLLANYHWSPAQRQHLLRLHAEAQARPPAPPPPPPEQPLLIPRDPAEGVAPNRPPRLKRKR
jgi:hypothetical protein